MADPEGLRGSSFRAPAWLREKMPAGGFAGVVCIQAGRTVAELRAAAAAAAASTDGRHR